MKGYENKPIREINDFPKCWVLLWRLYSIPEKSNTINYIRCYKNVSLLPRLTPAVNLKGIIPAALRGNLHI